MSGRLLISDGRGLRVEGMREDPDDPRHGTLNGYNRCDCRCDRCREAKKAAYRERGYYRNAAAKRRRQRLYRDRFVPPLNVSPFDRIMFAREERI